jgi:hypothetical protein
MKRFQVGVRLEGHGYIDVDADTPEVARKMIQDLDVHFDIWGQPEEIDTGLLDDDLTVLIDSVVQIEDEDE